MAGRFRAWVVIVAITLVLPCAASAREFALGLGLGDPTGLSLRGEITPKTQIELLFGFGMFPGASVGVNAAFVWDIWDFLDETHPVSLIFYTGPGMGFNWYVGGWFAYSYGSHFQAPIGDLKHFGLSFHGVAGLRMPWHEFPMEMFFELAPVGFVIVMPNVAAYYDVNALFGWRWRF